MSKIVFDEDAWEDYLWCQLFDQKTLKKRNALIKDIARHPFEGIGKPEALKGEEGIWSRRVNEKDRLVYEPQDNAVLIKQCRGHYDDK